MPHRNRPTKKATARFRSAWGGVDLQAGHQLVTGEPIHEEQDPGRGRSRRPRLYDVRHRRGADRRPALRDLRRGARRSPAGRRVLRRPRKLRPARRSAQPPRRQHPAFGVWSTPFTFYNTQARSDRGGASVHSYRRWRAQRPQPRRRLQPSAPVRPRPRFRQRLQRLRRRRSSWPGQLHQRRSRHSRRPPRFDQLREGRLQRHGDRQLWWQRSAA